MNATAATGAPVIRKSPADRSMESFRAEYVAWLNSRARQLTDESLPDEESDRLYDEVEHRGRMLVATFVNEPDREWVHFKFEVIRNMLGCQAATVWGGLLWMILGALEADLIAAVGKLEEADNAKAWATMGEEIRERVRQK